MHAIEPIGQGIFRPLRLINLQFSEMLYSYYPLSASMVGSIYYEYSVITSCSLLSI